MIPYIQANQTGKKKKAQNKISPSFSNFKISHNCYHQGESKIKLLLYAKRPGMGKGSGSPWVQTNVLSKG